MERDGIICRSNSPWSSPVHMVRTVPDSYPLPNMLDFSERIVECKNFSKVDVLSPDLDASRRYPKEAIASPLGLFIFLCMTFGLRNAGNTFQQRMDHVQAGKDFVFVYLDGVIGNCSLEEHLCHMRNLFQWLQATGLVVNWEK
jgi:hypothetical protein